MSPVSDLWPTSSPSSTRSSSPRQDSEVRSADEEILNGIAQSALRQLKTMATSAFPSGEWKEKKVSANEAIYELKSTRAFRIVAKSMVPCTVDEISNVLSNEDADHFNAGMLELVGGQYDYGVNVRTIPTSLPDSHLSIKAISFSKANPLSSRKHSISFFDYVEAEKEQRTACRVVQALNRTKNLDADRQSIVGDALIGYILQEVTNAKHTVIFFYATHYVKNPEQDGSLRKETIQRFRKMAQVTTKWVDIAMRRRLGAQKILNPSCDVALSSQSESCMDCDQPFSALFRKRHFCHLCGHFTCGSCSSLEEVEARVGMVEKLRICINCITEVNKHVFEQPKSQQQSSPLPELLNLRLSDADTGTSTASQHRLYTIM